MAAPKCAPGRLSLAGYAGILKTVSRGGATWRSIAAKHGITRLTAQRILHYWTDVGFIHVRGWHVPAGSHQGRCPIYRFGPGVNVPWPGGMLPRKPAKVRPDLTMFTNVIRALMDDACLQLSIVKEAGISRSACSDLIALLHSMRLIYIAEFEERPKRGQGHPMYRWGPGRPDAIKRQPMPVEEVRRRTNERIAVLRRSAQELRLFAGQPTASAEHT